MAAHPRPALLTTPDRRRFHRAPLAVSGRILDARGLEHDCRTADLSAGGARLIAPARPLLGEGLVLYLSDIGRLTAKVSRLEPNDAFGVVFESTTYKREKIAEQMTWLLNKHLFEAIDASLGEEGRRAARYAPKAAITVSLEDGTALACDVLDVSLVGASVRTSHRRPDIGTWVRVGQTDGRVARYIEGGFAVDFHPRSNN